MGIFRYEPGPLPDQADEVGWDWVARRERSTRVLQAIQCWLLLCCIEAEHCNINPVAPSSSLYMLTSWPRA